MAQPLHTIYDINNYTFGVKEPKALHYENEEEYCQHLKEKNSAGLRCVVRGLILTHRHGHPYVFFLQNGNRFVLPGGRLRPGEDEVDGLFRKLRNKMKPEDKPIKWDVGDCIGQWWRPHFTESLYPYLPVHITKPVEVQKLFIVSLPESCAFSVPKTWQLVAIPLYDLYTQRDKFGFINSLVPVLLSRFLFASK
eukprot:GCRY01005012.1.p1 GENE.GCRY01005012.1~~GCRY01005012.1.p1  ORF type:complete len:194 (-),score=6.12 GCRY01005012.1:323-904(-)